MKKNGIVKSMEEERMYEQLKRKYVHEKVIEMYKKKEEAVL